MITMNTLDLFAREAHQENHIILRDFLPPEWFDGSDPCQQHAWLMIFQRAGFCEYTEGLRQALGIEKETKAGVGTFVKDGLKRQFVGVDDNGIFTWDFPPYALWQNTAVISAFLRFTVGAAPLHKDWAFAFHSELAEHLVNLEKKGHILEVLLSFGGRYFTPGLH